MFLRKYTAFFCFTCCLASYCIQAQSYYITTIAGTGQNGFSNDGSLATKALLNNPMSITTDTAGDVVISDWSNSRIRVVNSSGIISTIAGSHNFGFNGDGGPATAASFCGPLCTCFDTAGNIYVCDAGNERIRKISTSGIISTIAGNGKYGFGGDGGPATNASFRNPTGIASDRKGNIYVADVFNDCIRKIDNTGTITTIAGNGIPGYIGDGGPAALAEFYYPTGIATDKIGNIYIADGDNNTIRKIDTAGIIITVAGNGVAGFNGDGGDATLANLNYPEAIAIDADNNLFIADSYNNRIRMVNASGIITTIGGNGSTTYTGDDMAATVASFYDPTGLASDKAGNVYVADNYHERVRKLIKAERNLTSNSGPLTIYPTPNHGEFSVNMQNSQTTQQIEIYNALGQKIFYTNLNSNGITSINIGSTGSGIYLYRVTNKDGETTFTGRFIVL